MKRHQVMDLFEGPRNEPIGEWIDFPKNYPEKNKDKLLVKLKDDTQIFAYYYSDSYGLNHHENPKGRYFWGCSDRKPIGDVKAWKYLKD